MADLIWKTSLNDDIILKWDLFDWYDPTYKIGLSRQILDDKYTCIYAQDNYFVGEDTELILNFLRHKFKFANINYPGVIKNEYEQNLLSKNLYKYASKLLANFSCC